MGPAASKRLRQRASSAECEFSSPPVEGTPAPMRQQVMTAAFGLFVACTPTVTSGAEAWVALEGGPGPRWGHVSVVDSHRNRVLVFGGMGPNGKLGDLWEYRLGDQTWSPLPTTSGPSPRITAAGIADVARDRMVLVGGEATEASDEVWALDFETDTWALLGVGPTPRFDHGAATDGARAWFYAGFSAPFATLDDLWVMDLATGTWALLAPNGAKPAARSNVGFAYFGDALYVVGGHGALASTPDTWRYHLTENQWEPLSPAGWSSASAHFAYATDPECGVLWLFGGDNVDYRDVGFIDGLSLADNSFITLESSNTPPPRRHAAMSFDPTSASLVVVGGWQGVSSILSDSWKIHRRACP